MLTTILQARTINLTEKNSYYLRGEISEFNVRQAVKAITKIHNSLKPGEPIYLCLNTPGGSVFDGLQLINLLKSLDREIKTISFSSLSMGFSIVQNLGERLAINSATLMSHPVSSICMGNRYQIKQCLEQMEQLDNLLNGINASRLGISTKELENKIQWDWWISGPHLTEKNVVDAIVQVKCSSELIKATAVMEESFFGVSSKVKYSMCPLMGSPIEN